MTAMPSPILTDAFRHHVWATIRVLDACAGLDAAQLTTTVPGTYGSILDTLRHLVGGDVFYLDVLRGGEPEPFDEGSSDIPTLRAVMEGHDPVWQGLIAGDLDSGERGGRVRGERLRDARAARDSPRPGAVPRHGPPQPGLHRAHRPRHRASRDRERGTSPARTAACSRSSRPAARAAAERGTD